MERNFAKALAVTLRFEGGYVNHPSDPGGETNFGITYRVYNAYRKRKGLAPRSVRLIDETEKREIYREQYWNLVAGDDLPPGLDLCVFDFAVNSGPTRAVRELQKVLGVRTDGDMGNMTLEAAKKRQRVALISEYQAARLAFCRSLRTWRTFGKGWQARIEGVGRTARAWASKTKGETAAAPVPVALLDMPTEAKADPRELSVASTDTGKGAITTAMGTAGSMMTEAADKIEPLGDFSIVFRVVFGLVLVTGIGFTIYSVLKSIKREGTA